MQYDPVKDRLGGIADRHPVFKRAFFGMLNLVFLRAWYVKREIRQILGSMRGRKRVDVLDAGTGFAQYAYLMARDFPNVHVLAVDVKEDYLQSARRFIETTPQRDRVRFQVEDLTRLSVDGPFDLILSVDVMEHIEEDVAVFRHFERVLAPGGYVIINTPSDQGGSDVTDEGETSFIEEHVRDGYSVEELSEKLSRAGLEVVRSAYSYGPYGSAAWRMLVKRPIQWLGSSRAVALLLPPYYVLALPAGTVLNALDVRRKNETGTGLIVVARKPSPS